jgi:hypothetical protein
MDEQRILDEMERVLAADDPRLAARLAAFGQPGFGQALRTRRARATLSVMVLVLIAAVAAVIYLMSVLRPGVAPGPRPPSQTAQPGRHQPGAQLTSAAPPGLSPREAAGIRPGTGTLMRCAKTVPPPRCVGGG